MSDWVSGGDGEEEMEKLRGTWGTRLIIQRPTILSEGSTQKCTGLVLPWNRGCMIMAGSAL